MFSLTIVSGPCRPDSTGSSLVSEVTQQSLARPGCNIRTVDNTTLVPTLVRDAAVSTSQPLLVRVTANVTLGPGLLRPISIRRPVLLLGMASALTSVDLGMVVNQLNVTSPYGKIYWQSLVLENLAPGAFWREHALCDSDISAAAAGQHKDPSAAGCSPDTPQVLRTALDEACSSRRSSCQQLLGRTLVAGANGGDHTAKEL